jgi:ligand-binding sensor domain-containing protein
LIFCNALAPLKAQLLPSHRYTTKDGLVADRVTAISQDENGVMWFGSFFGLGSYDGISFKKVNLPFEQQNKFVTAVLPMGNKVYAGFIFGGGLVELNGGKVMSFSLTQLDSTNSNDITAIGKFDDKSIIVANGENEIYKFSEGKFTYLYSFGQELSNSSVHVLYKDESKNIWVGTGGGLFVIPPSGSKNILRFFPQSNILSLLPTANGKIWIAVSKGVEGTIYLCDGVKGDELAHLVQSASVAGLRSPGFQGNTHKGFWGVHSLQGLFNIEESGKIKYYPSALNPNADLTALFADREHNLWIANDPGLIKISNFSSVSWNFKHPAAAGGYILRDEDGATWGE